MAGKKITFALMGVGSREYSVCADSIHQNPEQAKWLAVPEPARCEHRVVRIEEMYKM